jgi:hypothetical protein
LVEIANKLADANEQLTKRVAALESDLGKYKQQNDAAINAAIQSDSAQISKTRLDLLEWDQDSQYSPPQGKVQDQTPRPVPSIVPYGGNGSVICNPGYYMVGLYIERTGNGVNGIQLICRRLNVAGP